MRTSFMKKQRENAARWKQTSPTLPEAARVDAPYVPQAGQFAPPEYAFCLPAEYARLTLLPEIRETALALFAELGIPWHAGIDGGPSNHLLSSQVQCVNALAAMVEDPCRLVKAFGNAVDIAEVLEIEPGRFLTFEYIGEVDHLGEGGGKPRTRGARCTSLDAAFLYRTSEGAVELALVEWKYTESYGRFRTPAPDLDAARVRRYEPLYRAPGGPVNPLVPVELLFDEPFYQLLRQQLLAHELERHRAHGAEAVRVLHVLDPANTAYQKSVVRAEMKDLGGTVSEIWSLLLRDPSRFVHVDPGVFLDAGVTCDEYVARYG